MSLVSQFLLYNERCTHHFTGTHSKCVLSSSLVPSYMSWKQKCSTLKEWIFTVGNLLFPWMLEGGWEATGSPPYFTLFCVLDLQHSRSQQICSSPAHTSFLKPAYFRSTGICDVTLVSILFLDCVHCPHLNDISQTNILRWNSQWNDYWFGLIARDILILWAKQRMIAKVITIYSN